MTEGRTGAQSDAWSFTAIVHVWPDARLLMHRGMAVRQGIAVRRGMAMRRPVFRRFYLIFRDSFRTLWNFFKEILEMVISRVSRELSFMLLD